MPNSSWTLVVDSVSDPAPVYTAGPWALVADTMEEPSPIGNSQWGLVVQVLDEPKQLGNSQWGVVAERVRTPHHPLAIKTGTGIVGYTPIGTKH